MSRSFARVLSSSSSDSENSSEIVFVEGFDVLRWLQGVGGAGGKHAKKQYYRQRHHNDWYEPKSDSLVAIHSHQSHQRPVVLVSRAFDVA